MFHCINISQFIHSVADRHLDCLQFYPITNNSAVKILVLASLPFTYIKLSSCLFILAQHAVS